MKLLIKKGSDPNMFHDHGFHAIFQLFVTANTLACGEKLAVVDWVIRMQEVFEFDVHAIDLFHRDLTQVIIQSEMDTSVTGAATQSRLVNALLTNRWRLENQDFEGSTALHEATKRGRLDIVEQLLNGFAKPTTKDNRGRTPIHYAASLGNVTIIRRLLDKNTAGVDDSDDFGWTPLRLAVHGHHLDMVKFLVDLSAHCDYVLLTEAELADAEDLFDYFLALGIKPNTEILSLTIYNSNLHYLRNSILAGASLNVLIGKYFTPLTHAVFLKKLPTVQLLLSMGADVNLRAEYGDSALLHAVRNGELAIVAILLRAGAATHDLSFRNHPTINLIALATQTGYACIAQMLCKAGAPKPAADRKYDISNFGITAAARQNRVDILTELVRKRGDPSMIQEELYDAFEWACMDRNSEAAIFLINANLDLHAERQFPPLCRAAKFGVTDVVQVLLEKGVDTNQLSFEGQTALISVLDMIRYKKYKTGVAYDEVTRIVEKLIRAGVDVNVVDKKGHTALGRACWHGSTSIVKLLLEAGANISIPSYEEDSERYYIDPNNDGWSQTDKRYLPLELAARAGHEDIVQLLLAKGADWRSLKQQKAIATSHTVLVTSWFADEGSTDDEETVFLGCEPPEAQLNASVPHGAFLRLYSFSSI